MAQEILRTSCINNYNTPEDITNIIIGFGIGPVLPETTNMLLDIYCSDRESVDPSLISRTDEILSNRDVLPYYVEKLPNRYHDMQFTITLLAIAHKLDTYNNSNLIRSEDINDTPFQYNYLADKYSTVYETSVVYDIKSQVTYLVR